MCLCANGGQFFFFLPDDQAWYNLTVTVDNTSSLQSVTLHRQGDYFALYPVPLWKGHLVGQEMTPQLAERTELLRLGERPSIPPVDLGPAPEGPRPTMATLAQALAANEKPIVATAEDCSDVCQVSEEEEEEELPTLQLVEPEEESAAAEPPAAKKKKEDQPVPDGPATRRRKESAASKGSTNTKKNDDGATAAAEADPH